MANRIGQIFSISGFNATKVSVYLKKVGSNTSESFDITDGATLDATNFYTVNQCQHAELVLDETEAGFSGNGYMRLDYSSGTDYPSLVYPISTTEAGNFYAFFRINALTGSFKASVYIDAVDDEHKIASFNSSVETGWLWHAVNFALPDSGKYNLIIRTEENNLLLDKINISRENNPPTENGPDYSLSPFVTVHLQVFDAPNNAPTSVQKIYACKNSIYEVTKDDWYNFDIRCYDGTVLGDGVFATVISASGGSTSNYILWDLMDSDDSSAPSLLKI